MLYSNDWMYGDGYRDTIGYYVMSGLATLLGITMKNRDAFNEIANRLIYSIDRIDFVYDPRGWYDQKSIRVEFGLTYNEVVSKYPEVNMLRPPFPESYYSYWYYNLIPDLNAVKELAYQYFNMQEYFVYPISDIELMTFLFLVGVNASVNNSPYGNADINSIISTTCKKTWILNDYGYPVVPNNVTLTSVIGKSLNTANYSKWFPIDWQNVFIDIANTYQQWPLCDAFGAYRERQSEIISSGNQQDVLNQSELTTVLQTMKTNIDNEKYRQSEILRIANDSMTTELRNAERDFNAMVINAAMIAGING